MKPATCNLLFICLIGFTLPAPAQLLYKATAPGTGTTSYFFGTIHKSAADIQLPDTIATLLQQVKEVYLEILQRPKDARKAWITFQAKKHYPKGSTIKNGLTAGQYRSLKAAFVKTGKVTEKKFDNHFADLIPYILLMKYYDLRAGDDGKGFELPVETLAAKKGVKTIRMFETHEQLVEWNLLYAQELQPSFLVQHLDSLYNIQVDVERSYINMDTAAMHNYTNSDTIITHRNKLWMQTLLPKLPSTPCLIAVGAAHLPGPQGLLNLLKQEGYMIETIPFSFRIRK